MLKVLVSHMIYLLWLLMASVFGMDIKRGQLPLYVCGHFPIIHNSTKVQRSSIRININFKDLILVLTVVGSYVCCANVGGCRRSVKISLQKQLVNSCFL